MVDIRSPRKYRSVALPRARRLHGTPVSRPAVVLSTAGCSVIWGFGVWVVIVSLSSGGRASLGRPHSQPTREDYFGVLATTGPGPINFIDIHPQVQTTFPKDVTASFDWIFQWRESLEDGVYAVPGFLIRAADGSRARYVGNRPGTQIRWQATRHLWFQGDYGIFFAGPFLKEMQPGRNLNYWAAWAGYKF
jgi:hypothetical protein